MITRKLTVLVSVTAILPLLLCGCKFEQAASSVGRYSLFETKDGLVLRLNTESGEVSRVTADGITQLGKVGDPMPPDVKALVEKYTTTKGGDLKSGGPSVEHRPPNEDVQKVK